jgi:hypothetical protein
MMTRIILSQNRKTLPYQMQLSTSHVLQNLFHADVKRNWSSAGRDTILFVSFVYSTK